MARKWLKGEDTHTISKDASNNLKREPAVMAKLNHLIIVSLHRDDDFYCLVLDFYPGGAISTTRMGALSYRRRSPGAYWSLWGRSLINSLGIMMRMIMTMTMMMMSGSHSM